MWHDLMISQNGLKQTKLILMSSFSIQSSSKTFCTLTQSRKSIMEFYKSILIQKENRMKPSESTGVQNLICLKEESIRRTYLINRLTSMKELLPMKGKNFIQNWYQLWEQISLIDFKGSQIRSVIMSRMSRFRKFIFLEWFLISEKTKTTSYGFCIVQQSELSKKSKRIFWSKLIWKKLSNF